MSEPNYNRRTFLKRAGVKTVGVAVGITTLVSCNDNSGTKNQSGIRVEDVVDNLVPGTLYSATIPASFAIDLNSGRLSGNRQEVVPRHANSYLASSLDYAALEYDADQSNLDMRWDHTNEVKKSLKSEENSGVRFAPLTKKLEELTIGDLKSASYTQSEIIGDNSNNKLKQGAVYAVRLSNGQYAAFQVDGYLDLKPGLSWKSLKFWQKQPTMENLHLNITYKLFESQNS